MNRATFIEKLTEVQQTVEQLLAQLQTSEADKFVAHLYQARRQYRLVSERPNKGNKAIEREVISLRCSSYGSSRYRHREHRPPKSGPSTS
jgi:hypothetical protein